MQKITEKEKRNHSLNRFVCIIPHETSLAAVFPARIPTGGKLLRPEVTFYIIAAVYSKTKVKSTFHYLNSAGNNHTKTLF